MILAVDPPRKPTPPSVQAVSVQEGVYEPACRVKICQRLSLELKHRIARLRSAWPAAHHCRVLNSASRSRCLGRSNASDPAKCRVHSAVTDRHCEDLFATLGLGTSPTSLSEGSLSAVFAVKPQLAVLASAFLGPRQIGRLLIGRRRTTGSSDHRPLSIYTSS